MAGAGPQNAVVTGAAAGMGRAHVFGLLDAGFKIAALDRDVKGLDSLKQEVDGLGMEIMTEAVDVSDEKSVCDVFTRLISRIGRIDVLVNNAGAALSVTPFEDTQLEDWEADIRLNLTSQFLCIRAVLPTMKKQGAGSIINIATTSAFSGITASLYRSGKPANFVPYVSAKAGVIGMTRALAREIGASGIRVNAVAPGFTPTPRVEAVFPKKAIDRMVEDQAMKKVQRADDVTGAVVYLACDAARAVTGQVIRVDCGGSMGS